MAHIIETGLKRHLPGTAAVTLVLYACLALGPFAASAGAQPYRNNHHDHHDNHYDHRDDHWHGGYYAPPPVVYSGPVYYPPPPVVYGPGVSINLPGVSIGIQ